MFLIPLLDLDTRNVPHVKELEQQFCVHLRLVVIATISHVLVNRAGITKRVEINSSARSTNKFFPQKVMYAITNQAKKQLTGSRLTIR